MKTLIVIPAYNEEKNIKNVLEEMKQELPEVDKIVIDDHSQDNTRQVVEAQGVKSISLPCNLGYSLAVQTGIKYAKEYGYECVLQMDADGQHIAKEAKKLLKCMQEKNPDIVIGSRFIEPTGYHHGVLRTLGTKMLSSLIQITCHQKITDPTSGFQCINTKTIERFSQMGNYPEFPDANLLIELLLDGFTVIEVPTSMRERQQGESMHQGIIKPTKYMVKVLYTIIIVVLRNIFRKKKKQ